MKMKVCILLLAAFAALTAAMAYAEPANRVVPAVYSSGFCTVQVEEGLSEEKVTVTLGGPGYEVALTNNGPAELRKGSSLRAAVRAFSSECASRFGEAEATDWRIRRARLTASYYLQDRHPIDP